MQYRIQPYLNVPAQSQTTLSFCEPNPKHLKHWVESLPMANIGETSRQLYHAIIELNQLTISDVARLELLDLIRDSIHFVCAQLNKKYLNQGLVLTEKNKKIANLAQALQTHLATGYKIVVQHALGQGTLKTKSVLAKSLHRALSELLPAMLRSYQLYIQTPPGIWQEAHQLYQIASAFNIQTEVVIDPIVKGKHSIQQIYIQTLLLGTCQPNQLLQPELQDVYQSIRLWADYLQLDEVADEKSVLVINPETDSAPQYRYLVKTSSLSDYIGLNLLPLVKRLHADHKILSQTNSDKKPAIVPLGFNISLLEHLIQSWGGMKQRSFSRTPANGQTQIAVGLTATHFHIAGEVGFYSLLYGTETHGDNPFIGAVSNRFNSADTTALKSQYDVWNDSFDANGHPKIPSTESIEFNATTEEDLTESHPQYSGQLINISPRGYCIQWIDSTAANLKTGEVIAVKESKLRHWNLGVVRWIRQGRNLGTQMGVELLAPNSQPCGVRQLHKTGNHGDYLRALHIPEIKAIGQEASILTSKMPFTIGNKVTINLQGQEVKYQLIKRIMSTGIISQFQIRKIATKVDEPTHKQEVDTAKNFESLWRQL